MISTDVGVVSHRELYGNNAKKAHILSAVVSPKLPATKGIFARTGKKGIHKLATRPIVSDQKQIRGSTSKLVNGETTETLLKWDKSRGKVPSMAAVVSAIPAMNHLKKDVETLAMIEVGEVSGVVPCFVGKGVTVWLFWNRK